MPRYILWCGIIVLISLFFPTSVSASVVINEIFANPENEEDEFIELFNNSDSEIDLANWKIKDLVKSYTIIDLKIPPKSFLLLEKSLTGIALNNSDEEVTIVNSTDTVVDAFTYSETIEGKTWSRFPDGTGSFSDGTSPTKGFQNASAPTPTPLPTNTPTPTNVPTPTKEPTPTKSPTATKAPTSTKSPTLALNRSDVEDEDIPTVSKATKNNSIPVVSTPKGGSVAGVSDIASENIETNNSDKEKEAPSYLYSVTTGIGMLVLACGILLYRKFKVKKEEDDDF